MKNNAETVTFHGIDIPETAIYKHLASCGKMPGKSLNNYQEPTTPSLHPVLQALFMSGDIGKVENTF